MSGKDTVRARAADRETGSLEMSDADLQDSRVNTVIHGELYPDFSDINIAHDAGSGDIKCCFIAVDAVRQIKCAAVSGKRLVIGFRDMHHACDRFVRGVVNC